MDQKKTINILSIFLIITIAAQWGYSAYKYFRPGQVPCLVEKGFKNFKQNTYCGRETTPKMLLELTQYVPQTVQEPVKKFLSDNKKIAEFMSGDDAFQGAEPVVVQDEAKIIAYVENVKKEVQALGHPDMSNYNFAFDVPNSNVVVKASSILERSHNLDTACKLLYASTIPLEKWDEYKTTYGDTTYQTISRMAYWLRMKEAKKLFKLDKLELPQKYLIHIPGRPTELSDTNYVVAVDKIVGEPFFKSVQLFDTEIVKQLVTMIEYVGIWELIGSDEQNVMVVQQHGKPVVYLYNIQQPDIHSPLNFFNKSMKIFASDASIGVNQLKKLIAQETDQMIKALGDKKEYEKVKHYLEAQAQTLVDQIDAQSAYIRSFYLKEEPKKAASKAKAVKKK